MKRTIAAALLLPAAVFALPFNDDMVDIQPKVGQVMRPSPAGSVALGSSRYRTWSRDEALALTNPLRDDANSPSRGNRLYAVNCRPCHGEPNKDPAKWGASRPIVMMPGPNLADPLYHRIESVSPTGQGRTDGQIYAQIYHGGAIMPRVGYKLSPNETWDIINYIRSIQ